MTYLLSETPTHGGMPHGVRVWVLAARPRTLFAAAGPVLQGLVMAAADGVFHAPAAVATLVCALLLQVGANYINDYSDGIRGTDTGDRLGPPRAVQSGWVSPQAMRWAAVVVLGIAFVVGLYLVCRGGWLLFGLGLLAITSAVVYTAGPFPLGYYGIAEPFVFVFFGPVAVAGTWCVQTGEWSPAAIAAGCGPGLLSVALLTVNNIRDLPGDRLAGKRTLAVRLGENLARKGFAGCVGTALVIPPWLSAWLAGVSPGTATVFTAVVASATAIPATRLIRDVKRFTGKALNGCLARTGQMIFLYCLVFAMAWWWTFRVIARP